MIARSLDLFHRARPVYVALAFAVYAISVPLVALRWRMVLRGLRRGAPCVALRPLVLASLAASFVNNVTPAARVSGEACRIVALTRLKLASLPQAVASIFFDRISEIPAIAVLVLIALAGMGRVVPAWLLLAAPGATALVVLTRGAWPQIWSAIVSRWTALDLVAVKPSALAAAAGLSGAIWILDVARLRAASAAFQAPIGTAQAAALSVITIVGGLVPTMGGLGAIEGGLVAGLIAFGASPSQAIAVAAVERSISYGVATLAGFGALSILGGRELWTAMRRAESADRATP